MSEELEVIWTGAHLGRNADLFCHIPYAEPVPDSPRDRRAAREIAGSHRNTDQIAAERHAVLACLRMAACKRKEIRAVTGLNEQAVAVAILQLQRDGLIRNDGYGIWVAES